MTGDVHGVVAMQPCAGRASGMLAWKWPGSPKYLKIYDKYSDTEITVSRDDACWVVLVGGVRHNINFSQGAAGRLQRKMVMLTQQNKSPAAIYRFSRLLIRNWPLYTELLQDGPMRIADHWSRRVVDIETAYAAKIILEFVCIASLGTWREAHLAQVKCLDTRARATILAQNGRIRRREGVLGVDIQAILVKVLDECASNVSLSEKEAEGLTALALLFQHGLRPVQLLSLRLEHVHLFRDASGHNTCVITFHAAKQRGGTGFEMIRQVRQEWIPYLEQLLAFAKCAGRRRLFLSVSVDQLWLRVKAVCAKHGVGVPFTAKTLRSTAAQSLADAGKDRESIRKFLGHKGLAAAKRYVMASQQMSDRINVALGTSKLYGNILLLASGEFISPAELTLANEDQQIGAIVGERLVAGVGLCRTGQKHCSYNPVTSCYGCSKFKPSLDRSVHEEAIAGMREQVRLFIDKGGGTDSPAYMQLTRALAGAQQAIRQIDDIATKANERVRGG